ncbi:hypothetical protein HanIR_Chr17g0891711 [Helianthus annuus]|nr:hypothetical protein HanIR_Chr17g0891711 [Helianthus annuus]
MMRYDENLIFVKRGVVTVTGADVKIGDVAILGQKRYIFLPHMKFVLLSVFINVRKILFIVIFSHLVTIEGTWRAKTGPNEFTKSKSYAYDGSFSD